jgi:hypothetical protein
VIEQIALDLGAVGVEALAQEAADGVECLWGGGLNGRHHFDSTSYLV